MRAAFGTVWALALASLSHAADLLQLPPAQFDRPYPYMRVETGATNEIDRHCRRRHAGNRALPGRIIECAVFTVERGRVVCTLILPRWYSARLYRHARGHCWGWVHDY